MSEGRPRLTFHDYWRSGASYRVRIALNIKGLPYERASHDLRQGAHRLPSYRAINPQGLVPALEVDGMPLTQSGAIIEWLDERYPTPPLMPADPDGRAIVRAMSKIVACDIHPLNNSRVLNYLRQTLDCDEARVLGWIATWMRSGFAALEELVAQHGGRFAYGDALSMADCHLVPQFYGAQRFNVATGDFPHLTAVVDNALAEEPVRLAHPELQLDAG